MFSKERDKETNNERRGKNKDMKLTRALGRALMRITDQAGRRTAMYGTIDNQDALLVVERAPFPTSEAYLGTLPSSLAKLKNLGANDIYSWSMARTGSDPQELADKEKTGFFADLKINLIYPCTESHVKKYSKQRVRFVTETPELYRDRIKPFMQTKRDQGRLNWVFNIIQGLTEVEDVIYRTELGEAGDEGFLLLPDLNWDRTTLEALHLLGVVERRDIWSLRDLKKKHVPWLQHMKDKMLSATVQTHTDLEADQLKLYVHYQPTYYHFHIHIVHVALEAGATQATGKAVSLDSIIETLKIMQGGEEAGMDALSMTYTLGEASELWTDVYEPLKKSDGASR
ncbi:Scavenger mRNA decapping enzyme [Moelleriella libera RCEF 2490]|uniref:Scavenger mRNA decapping enzyme n=1 Tax=Moelleriella libera RCEF 2490 TaxID=1081109 RepID=A0A167XTI9_9HYPO|nr:Scavenger mRNA decapping enzyme [Moelleriella libera RCEF 2490]